MISFIRRFLYFIIAGTIIIVGIINSVCSFLANNPIKDRVYLNLNGISEVSLESGKYSIFYEYRESNQQYGPIHITKNNKISNLLDLIRISITSSDKEAINMRMDSSMSYTINKRKGESIYSFQVDHDNNFMISTQLREELEELVQLTLMKDFTKELIGLLSRIGIMLLISVPFIILGIIVVRREISRKRSKS